MKHRQTNSHILSTALFISVLQFQSCTEIRSAKEVVLNAVVTQSQKSVVQFVADKIARNRIVMIADHGHGKIQFMLTVTDVLQNWIDTGTASQVAPSFPRSVMLVLETDSIQAATIQQYATSGDIRNLLTFYRFCSTVFNTGNLEFYSDLGVCLQRVRDFNSRQSDTARHLHLQVVGAEKPIDLHKWTYENGDDYFLNERDEDIADRITKLAESRPDYHLLVFYGSSHLRRAKALKSAGNKEKEGYYLAHYLGERFGHEGGVYTIGQVHGEDWGQFQPIFDTPEKPFALDHRAFQTLKDEYPGLVYYDGSINLRDPAWIPWPLYSLPSDQLTDFIIDSMPQITDVSNEFSWSYWPSIISYLETISAATPERLDIMDSTALSEAVQRWQSWHATFHPDFPGDIASLAFWNHLIDRFQKLNGHTDAIISRRYEELINAALLTEPPIQQIDGKWPLPPERSEQHRKFLAENKDWLVNGYLVNMLWVGTEAECKRAMTLLSSQTGQKFQSKKEWATWWRHRQETKASQHIIDP